MWIIIAILMFVLSAPLSASANTVTLTWDANTESDLAGYRIYRDDLACSLEGPKPLLAQVGVVTSYVDSTVPNNWTVASYRITAVDTSNNESARSLCVEKSFSNSSQLIGPPNLRYSVSGSSITIQWDPVTDASNYLLRVHKYGTSYDPCESMVFCGAVTGTSKTLTLEYGSTYDFWVHAQKADGTIGPSSGNSMTMPSSSPPPVMVAPPNFRYSLSGTTATIQWDTVEGAVEYLLRVHKIGTEYNPCESMVFCGSVVGLSKNLTLEYGAEYDIWVYAKDGSGTVGPSSGNYITMPTITPPPQELSSPKNFRYSVSGTTITLQWDAVYGANDYFLSVHKYGTPIEPCASLVFCGALYSTFKSFTLDPGEIYELSVYARKWDGTPGPVSINSVTMPAAIQDPTPRTQPLDFHILQLTSPLRLSVEPLASAGCTSITVTVAEKVATVLCVK